MFESCRTVVVGVSATMANLAALRAAVEEARARRCRLVAVHAWAPVGGEFNYRRQPCREMLDVWRRGAAARLDAGFDEAFGGLPPDLEVELEVLRAAPGPALVAVADEHADMLVLGAGRLGWTRRISGRVTPYCLRHATCPVVVVPPSELAGLVRGSHAQRTADRPLHFRHNYG